jgi:hypothetical protein
MIQLLDSVNALLVEQIVTYLSGMTKSSNSTSLTGQWNLKTTSPWKILVARSNINDSCKKNTQPLPLRLYNLVL